MKTFRNHVIYSIEAFAKIAFANRVESNNVIIPAEQEQAVSQLVLAQQKLASEEQCE
jgi:hypothetical protein